MRYNLSLVEWITLGLNKEYSAKAVENIHAGRPLDAMLEGRAANKRYIEKVLREEVFKQFSDNRRPIIEVLLNSIDAKPHDFVGDYKIDVRVGNEHFSAKDYGRGMGLEDVLRLLIIPFSTEKTGLEEIGKFGVGFLSTFNYCLNSPGYSNVHLETGNGEEFCQLKFYSSDKNAENIRMTIKTKKSRKRGAFVAASGIGVNGKKIITYIQENLASMPTYQAMISINKKYLNVNNKEPWYDVDVDMDVDGNIIRQKLGFKYRPDSIEMLSQGVSVTKLRINSEISSHGALISLPSAVKLVEGRDEFKKDENYKICVSSTFLNLEHFINDQFTSGAGPDKKDVKKIMTKESIANYIANICSALDIGSIKNIPNLRSILKKHYSDCEYAVSNEDKTIFGGFFSPESMQKCLELTTPAVVWWTDILKPSDDFLKSELLDENVMKPFDFCDHVLDNRMKSLSSVKYLLEVYKDTAFDTIHLVKLRNPGHSPFMAFRKRLYINMNHENITSGNNMYNAYLNTIRLFQLPRILHNTNSYTYNDIMRRYLQHIDEWDPRSRHSFKEDY